MHLSSILLGIFCHQVMKTEFYTGHYYFLGTDMRPQPKQEQESNITTIQTNLLKRNLLFDLENPQISSFEKLKRLKQANTNDLHFSYKLNKCQ
jgi:hypothetical protein